MGEETQLGASIEELTGNLNDDDDNEAETTEAASVEDMTWPEDNVSRWVNPREVGRWTDVIDVVNNQQVHIYSAVVKVSDVEDVADRLAEGNCDVREVYDDRVCDGHRRIEFEESHCPF